MYKTIVVKSLQRARRNITKDFYSKSLFNYKTIPTVQPISKEYGLVSNIMKSGSFYQFLVDSHKECGDVITFNLFDRSSISINHPELFHKFTKVFNRMKEKKVNNQYATILGEDSIFFAEDDDGKARRKNYIDVIMSSNSIQTSYFHHLTRIMNNELELWNKTEQSKEELNLTATCYRLTLNLIVSSIVGEVSPKEISYIIDCYNFAYHELYRRAMFRDIPAPGSERDLKYNEVIKGIKDFFESKIDSNSSNTIFMEHLKKENDRNRTISEAMGLVFAGHHTTGNSLVWTLYYLFQNPNTLKKAVEEVDSVLGDSKIVTYDMITKLRYLKACVNEALRLSSLVPMQSKVDYENDIVIEERDMLIPKGTGVYLFIGGVNSSENVWNKPEEFRPERFKEESAKFHHQFIPFAMPGRVCPGKAFSYVEQLTVLSSLLKNFKYQVTNEKVNIDYGIVVAPKEEIKIKLEKRL